MYGRVLFGVSASLFGVVVLMSHSSDVLHRLLASAQIAGGIGMLSPRTTRLASIVLGIAYVLLSLATIPGIIAAPAQYVSYGNFFEQLAVVCGAAAVYAAADTNAARSVALRRTVRFGLGACTVSFTLAQITYLQFTASLVPTWIPPNEMFWALFTTIAFGFAAVAMLLNLQARLAMQMMAMMLGLFGLLVWVPHIVTHPMALGNWSEFAETYLIAGAAWISAGLQPTSAV